VGSLSKFWTRLACWLADAGDPLVSIAFPAPCRLCERLLLTSSRVPICEDCLASFAPIPQPFCTSCGRWIVSPQAAQSRQPLCRLCLLKTYAFDRARSYAVYDGAMSQAMILLKYEAIEPLGRWFADRLVEVAGRESEALAADVVVPVPLHRDRQRERGYNQVDLIAGPLARRLGLPYRSVLLVRSKPRPDKLHLSLHERWTSVRGAFAARPGSRVDNLRVLLVDDVMTTGATLDACARALRRAGAAAVYALTVARAARGSPMPPVAAARSTGTSR
jgi:ComF family protein